MLDISFVFWQVLVIIFASDKLKVKGIIACGGCNQHLIPFVVEDWNYGVLIFFMRYRANSIFERLFDCLYWSFKICWIYRKWSSCALIFLLSLWSAERYVTICRFYSKSSSSAWTFFLSFMSQLLNLKCLFH